MLEAIDERRAHHRLPDLRLLEGRDRHASSPHASRAGPRRRAGAGAPRRVGRTPIDTRARRADGRRPASIVRWFRPLRPAAARAGQPPHPPQGADRRRGRRRSPAASASPTSGRATPRTSDEWRDTHFRIRGPGGRRAARRVPRQLGRDRPELFDDDVDRFPDQPQAGLAVVQCVRGASETGWSDVATLVPHAAADRPSSRIRIATAYFVPDDEIIERLCDAARPRRRGRDPAARARTPTSGSCSWRARRRTTRCSTPASSIWNFQPSMLHAKIMTVDGVVAERRLGQPQRPLDRARRGDQRRRDRHRPRRGPRPPLRRRPRAQRAPRRDALAGSTPPPAGEGGADAPPQAELLDPRRFLGRYRVTSDAFSA